MPHVLNVVVVFHYVEHLVELLYLLGIGERSIGGRDLFRLGGSDLVAELAQRFSDFVDLKCRLSWQATSWLTLFARGENLLNKSYMTMDGFPEPGITVFGGLSVSL